jgi:hypothetical protein
MQLVLCKIFRKSKSIFVCFFHNFFLYFYLFFRYKGVIMIKQIIKNRRAIADGALMVTAVYIMAVARIVRGTNEDKKAAG